MGEAVCERSNQHGGKKPKAVFPLQRVVLGVPATDGQRDERFDSTCTDKFTTSLLLAVCQRQLTVTQGETLTVPSDNATNSGAIELKVMECEPLLHGAVTVTTQIVLAKLPMTPEEDSASNATSDIPVSILASDFTRCAALNTGQNVETPSPSRISVASLNVSIVADWRRLISRQQCLSTDEYSVIGLSRATMNKYGLFSDSLVTAKSHSSHQKRREHSGRVARIQVLEEADDDVALMLPTLWFNLTKSWKGRSQSQNLSNCVTIKVSEKDAIFPHEWEIL